jgi:hypothetical protein
MPVNAPGCHGSVLASIHSIARMLSSLRSSQASDSQAERPWRARPLPRPGTCPSPCQLDSKNWSGIGNRSPQAAATEKVQDGQA